MITIAIFEILLIFFFFFIKIAAAAVVVVVMYAPSQFAGMYMYPPILLIVISIVQVVTIF